MMLQSGHLSVPGADDSNAVLELADNAGCLVIEVTDPENTSVATIHQTLNDLSGQIIATMPNRGVFYINVIPHAVVVHVVSEPLDGTSVEEIPDN